LKKWVKGGGPILSPLLQTWYNNWGADYKLYLLFPPQQIHHLGQGASLLDLLPDAVFFFQDVHGPVGILDRNASRQHRYPVIVPRSQSPGSTLRLPMRMGTLISPNPLGSPAFGITRRIKAGKPSLKMSPESRMAPSMTTPARPRWMAEWVASSPRRPAPRLRRR